MHYAHLEELTLGVIFKDRNISTETLFVSPLPIAWYRDPDPFQAERHALFAKAWMPLAPSAALRATDAYVCTNLAGWPLFAWRDSHGTLRAFHNICRHQSMPMLKAGCGALDKLRCPYHGWTYAQDGRLTHAAPSVSPDVDDLSSIQLESIAIASWQGVLFASVASQDECTGPGELFAALDAHMPDLDDGWEYAGTDQVDLRCNWKTWLDYGDALQSPAGCAPIDVAGESIDGRVAVIAGSEDQGTWLWAWPLLGVHVTHEVVAVSQLVARTMIRSSLQRHVFVREGGDAAAAMAAWRAVDEQSRRSAEAAHERLAASTDPDTCAASSTSSPARFGLHAQVRAALDA